MSANLPFRVYPSCGMKNPPPIPAAEDGVFDAAGSLPDGSRLLLAYHGGVIVDVAVVEPGGDHERATLDLYCQVEEAGRTVRHADPEEATTSG